MATFFLVRQNSSSQEDSSSAEYKVTCLIMRHYVLSRIQTFSATFCHFGRVLKRPKVPKIAKLQIYGNFGRSAETGAFSIFDIYGNFGRSTATKVFGIFYISSNFGRSAGMRGFSIFDIYGHFGRSPGMRLQVILINTRFRHFRQSAEIREISHFGIFRICRKYQHVPKMPNLSKIFRFWICMFHKVIRPVQSTAF